MLNGLQWQDRYPEFLSETQALLSRLQECLLHLELINDDQDAIDGLIATLHKLSNAAENAAVAGVADFSRQLLSVLSAAMLDRHFQDNALLVLKDCFALLAWQLELIDPRDGLLMLDDSEQRELLANLTSATRPVPSVTDAGKCSFQRVPVFAARQRGVWTTCPLPPEDPEGQSA
ncbi:hypothetical protein AABC73_19370 [Pseudomonas sp. G.S.17]|uniref:hypothetical protein n=1 Tax=Pseudomonas sp. G.S.17 TaxID=3137451 RepID=UPI00311CB0B9